MRAAQLPSYASERMIGGALEINVPRLVAKLQHIDDKKRLSS